MAISKFQRWKRSDKTSDDLTKELNHVFEKPNFDDETLGVQMLHDKVHELTDLINTHITKMAANDAKATFPGFGTSNSTALRGDTTTISTSQASAITANTSKVSFPVTAALNNSLSFNINGTKLIITNTVAQPGLPGQPTPAPKTYSITLKLK